MYYGLLVDMGNEDYIVESNREGGYGRYDMEDEKRDGALENNTEFKTVKRRKRRNNGRSSRNKH